MKLVELLARELNEWTAGKVAAVQDPDADGTVWFVSSSDGLEFNGSEWRYSGYFEIAISRPSSRAEDYDSAIVTRAQWQAERDRQKGGEWKRHRGNGKQPKELGDFPFEVKHRDGNIWPVKGIGESCWRWTHDGSDDDIMQYRVISQPQAEEVEMKLNQRAQDELSKPDSEKGIIQHESSAAFFEHLGIAKTDQIDGPLAWRDTIIHCQAIIEDCEREIQRNVDLLDAEGLMMQTDSKKAMQHYAPAIDMSDWRNWKAGDLLKVVDSVEDTHDIDEGEIVIFDGQDINRRMDAARCTYNSDIRYYWILRENVEFHSRP